MPAQMTLTTGWESAVHNAGAGNFWALAIFLICLALACGYGIFYFIRRARIIEDTPTSKIRSAPQGYVEIIGRIKYLANEPLIAPLTKLPCAWYRFKIEKKQTIHTGKSRHTSWRTIEEATSERVFICLDETGQCMIDPRGAEVHANDDDTWYGSSKWPVAGRQTNSSFLSFGSYRYTEQRLIENEQLYAIGHFNTVDPNKVHGDISNEVRAILKIWKQDQQTLLDKFDDNNDQQIDMAEWQKVRDAAKQQAYQQRLSRADRPAINLMLKTNDFRRPYILSVNSPTKMTSKFKLKAFACLGVFVLSAPLALWMIIVRLAA